MHSAQPKDRFAAVAVVAAVLQIEDTHCLDVRYWADSHSGTSAEVPAAVAQVVEEAGRILVARSLLVSAVSMTLRIHRTIEFVRTTSGSEVAMRGPGGHPY